MNKKIIILGTIATGAIITATVVPIVLLNNKEEKIEKDNVIYANRIKALKTKIVTIGATSGDVKTNKNAILNKIKSLGDFPKTPKGITLDVKDSSQKLTINGVAIILIVKKEGESNIEIKDFKVKRSKTTNELATKSINNVKKILDQKSSKVITIINLQAKVGASGVANKIKAKVEEQIGTNNLDEVKVSISANVNNEDILDTGEGIGFKITLSKDDAPSVEIIDWKVKREKTQDEKDIDEVKEIFDEVNLASKIVTATFHFDNEYIDNNPIIVEALKDKLKLNKNNLKGVTIAVKPNSFDGELEDTGQGVGFIITLSKGKAPVVEITDWKLKREKTSFEKNIVSINRVMSILDSKNSKIITIVNLQAKVGSPGVANKIKAKIIKQIGENNLEGVTITISADSKNEDIIDSGQGIGFEIVFTKPPSQRHVIWNWKVKREKTQAEKDIDSIKTIFDEQSSKIVTITNYQTKVDTLEANYKIVNALKAKINQTNLKGVIISVKPDSTNADIIDTGPGIGFIITLSKGEAPLIEINNWKVKRIKTLNERNDDSISKVFRILNLKSSKVVTIINLQAKVGAIGVADKIKAKVEEQIGIENLDGVKVSISAADANEDILDTGEGVSFKIIISKGEFSSATINNWKVKREKTANEIIINVSNILKNKLSKVISIPLGNDLRIDDNAQIIAKIKIALQKEVGINNLENVIITPSKDNTNAIITTSQEGIGFKITLSKDDGTPIIIDNWKVKRKEFTEAESIDWVKFILDSKMFKLIKINNSQAKVGDEGVANKIKIALEEKIGLNNLEGITISISADTENEDIINSGQGIGFIITLSKGSAQSVQITNWKVRLKTSQ